MRKSKKKNNIIEKTFHEIINLKKIKVHLIKVHCIKISITKPHGEEQSMRRKENEKHVSESS